MAVSKLSGNPKIGPEDINVVLKFGGGLHTRASPDEIDGREAAGGFNFLIDIQNRNLRNRPAFDLIGTLPNAASVLGGASFLKSDGTVSTLFQGGDTVYQWNGATTFTSKGTVNAASKLRGKWQQSWNLATEVVLITDLSLLTTVQKWDGTTLGAVSFVDQAGVAFGSFYAKYLIVSAERAIFSNIKDGSGSFPHMIIGANRSDYTKITVTNRPAAALGDADPWFLVAPDNKPINGHLEAFGKALISTEKGQIFYLSGSTAKDFAFSPFYAGSAATGTESITEIGNDVIYGRQGRIESVRDTQNFGNSQSADLSAIVSDQIAAYTGWTCVFNSRLRRVYMFPTGVSEVWVMDTAIRDAGQLSPWMRWKTTHTMNFQPTFAMSMLDPADGLEYVFMGDSSGHIYRLEGTGTSGDGGLNQIQTQFLSKLISARLDSSAYDVQGYVKYGRNASATVTLTFKYQGDSIFDKAVTITLPAKTGGSYFGDHSYFGGGSYFGSTSGKLARKGFEVPGQEHDYQVQVDVTGTADISINEIGIRLRAAGQ